MSDEQSIYGVPIIEGPPPLSQDYNKSISFKIYFKIVDGKHVMVCDNPEDTKLIHRYMIAYAKYLADEAPIVYTAPDDLKVKIVTWGEEIE